jgi:hypothetical protein
VSVRAPRRPIALSTDDVTTKPMTRGRV